MTRSEVPRFVAQGRMIVQQPVERLGEDGKRYTSMGFIVGEVNEFIIDADLVAGKLVALLNEHWEDD